MMLMVVVVLLMLMLMVLKLMWREARRGLFPFSLPFPSLLPPPLLSPRTALIYSDSSDSSLSSLESVLASCAPMAAKKWYVAALPI